MKLLRSLGLLVVIIVLGTACAPSVEQDGTAESTSFALPGDAVTIISGGGNLELVTASARAGDNGPNELALTRWFTAEQIGAGRAEADWSMEGDTLRLDLACSGVILECDLKHRVEIPEGVKVNVRADDGSVSAKGFAEPLDLDVSNGNINVDDTTSALTLKTVDGSIRAEGLKSKSVKAKARNGYLILDFPEAPKSVRTKSVDGNTTITAPRGPYKIKADARDGTAKVSLPKDGDAGRSIDATSRNGSIKIRER